MDFQAFVDCCSVPCAVLSVQKTADGLCGEIRIVCSNQPYKEVMGPAYRDNMLYQELVPKDPKYEDFCFRAAHMKECLHAYVETRALGCWTDQVITPLESPDESIGYCQFVFKLTKQADPDLMSSVSMDTASAVIKSSIKLLSADDFREGVQKALSDIRELSDAFICRIMLIDHEERTAGVFCEAYAEGNEPDFTEGDGSIPYEVVNSWEAMVGDSNAIIVKNEQDMASVEQRNPEWVQSLRQYGVTSTVLVPLRRGKSIVGYLFVANFDVERVVKVKELVELMSFFLGSEISNYVLMHRLEELGTVDKLTGLLNRNAMVQCMAGIDNETPRVPFGVVNIDLNGLKAANDQHGHEAGDQLLVQAAHVLERAFRKSDLYRIGGDEFVVMATGMSREAFESRLGQLRAALDESPEVSFAIGSFWSDGSVGTREAYRAADAQMYTDKRAYYNANPAFGRDGQTA